MFDGSGKSTLIKELSNLYSELDVQDRGFISDQVYAKKFNRTQYEGVDLDTYLKYWKQWHKFNRDVVIVLCQPSITILANRCIEKKESFCRNRDYESLVNYLSKDAASFNIETSEVCESYNFPLLILDTSLTIGNCIKQIEEFISYAKV